MWESLFHLCYRWGLKVQDIQNLFGERIDGLKQYLNQGGEGYWAEPYFGYYRTRMHGCIENMHTC